MIHILTYVYIFYFQLGYELDDEKLNAVFSLFRDLTKNKKVFNFYIFCIFSCTCMHYGLTNTSNHIRTNFKVLEKKISNFYFEKISRT